MDIPEITQSFDVDQPPELVWRFFQDVPRVVMCMPGLEYGGARTGEAGEEIHRGKVRIKLGPVRAAFEGEAIIVDIDEGARSARIEGKGVDKRGGGRASASVVYRIWDQDGASRVRLDAEIKLSGALAQMGRTGIVQDAATQITQQFAESPRATLAAESGAAAAGAGHSAAPLPEAPSEIRGDALLLKIIWRRIKALFGWRGA